MVKYTFSKFVYFDTNILSHFAKNDDLWSGFFSYLGENDLTIGLGGGQVSELSDAKRLHETLFMLFMDTPTGIIKNWDEIIAEEVHAHPKQRIDTLLMYALNAILLKENGPQRFLEFLSSKELKRARRDQLSHAKRMQKRHDSLKRNFPPSKSGKYTREQADKFSKRLVFQWLSYNHKDFLDECEKQPSTMYQDVFLSIRLFGYVIFYKYYLGQREPKKLSDFGDLFHLFPLPYCELVVMERDLCNILNQIKRNHNILNSTIIHNIDFLKNWK